MNPSPTSGRQPECLDAAVSGVICLCFNLSCRACNVSYISVSFDVFRSGCSYICASIWLLVHLVMSLYAFGSVSVCLYLCMSLVTCPSTSIMKICIDCLEWLHSTCASYTFSCMLICACVFSEEVKKCFVSHLLLPFCLVHKLGPSQRPFLLQTKSCFQIGHLQHTISLQCGFLWWLIMFDNWWVSMLNIG